MIAKNYFIVISILSIFLLFNGCESKDKDMTNVKEYEGQSIELIVPKLAGKTIRGPFLTEVKEFENKTGAIVNIVTPSWSQTIQKTQESFEDENINYDIFVSISSWSGKLLSNNHIEELPQWVKDKLDWEDVLPIYKKNVLSWNNKIYGIPYDGDCINLYYRKDIFENKSYQERFKKEFGYELAVPKTWKEYEEVAKFFNAWDWDGDGEIEYGIAGSRLKGYGTMLQFFTRAAAYAKHPNNKGFYFNPENMKPNINNPAFIKALDEYISIMRYTPKEILNFSPGSVRDSFISGEVAMAIDWANIGTMSINSDISVVKDKVGYAVLPGNENVYNYETNRWEEFYNNVSSISGNWTMFVNKESKNKKLAFEFASYMGSKSMTSKLTTLGWTGVNPSRYSHFDNYKDLVNMGFKEQDAKEYLATIKESLNNKNVMVDIRIPGATRYYNIISKYIDLAIKKEYTTKEALNRASIEWDILTDKLGREKQIAFYKASINN
ncbi:MAG: extracellular solute-binding protein [Campylobacterota bacterium]|nr:extracellular solute-binding protein [Campylobacterota bacterium]